MKTVSYHLERVLGWLLVALMSLIVINVTWQVVTRFIMNDPSSFTEELARFLLIWIGFLGSAYAFRRHSHLSLDLLMQSVPDHYKPNLLRLSHFFCLLFAAGVMIYGGSQLMGLTLSLNQTSAALGIPIGYVYSCIPLSGLLICWFAIENIVYPTLPQNS